jgi:ABC-type polysaccharide/polyol phosphate export permease
MEELRELWKYRELLLIFVQRDLKVRYKNSVLGFGWSLVNPLVQVAIITVVLNVLGNPRLQPKNYHVYVFCAVLPWTFFNQTVMDASMSLLTYYNLLRRVYFPRSLIPLSIVISNLIHFLLATGVFLIYTVVNALFWWIRKGSLDWAIEPSVLLIPIPMLGLTLLVAGIAMVISVWTLYYLDIRFLADSGLRILYWLVPVLYFPEVLVSEDLLGEGRLVYNLYMLNPLSSFITAFRKLMLVPTTVGDRPVPPMGTGEWLFLLLALGTSLLVAAAGHRYFISQQWKLAERP